MIHAPKKITGSDLSRSGQLSWKSWIFVFSHIWNFQEIFFAQSSQPQILCETVFNTQPHFVSIGTKSIFSFFQFGDLSWEKLCSLAVSVHSLLTAFVHGFGLLRTWLAAFGMGCEYVRAWPIELPIRAKVRRFSSQAKRTFSSHLFCYFTWIWSGHFSFLLFHKTPWNRLTIAKIVITDCYSLISAERGLFCNGAHVHWIYKLINFF